MALGHSPFIVSDGLVLALDAANPKSYPGFGTTWNDLSGNGNNGTLINGVGYDGGNFGSLTFDGNTNYINCGSSSILNISNSITLESWILATSGASYRNVICKSSLSQNNGYIFPRTVDGWNNIEFLLHVGGWTSLTTPFSSYLNLWTHCVATYDGNGMKIYINGELKNSNGKTGSITTNTNFLSIGSQPGYGEFFKGNISNTRIYNRALTAVEITQNFNALRGRFGI